MKPNDPMNEFEADVRQTARQLNNLDFSHESQQREATRERLMDQIYSQKPAPNKEWWHQKTSRRPISLFALAGVAIAAFVLGLILFKLPDSTPSPAVAEPLVPTPDAPMPAVPTAQAVPDETPPIFLHPDLPTHFYYETLEEASQIFQGPIYAPSNIPEGYALAFVMMSTSDTSAPDLPPILTSVYFKKYDWRDAVMRADPGNESIDYLYIMQEAKSPTPQPQMRGLSYLLTNLFLYDAELSSSLSVVPEFDKQWGVAAGVNGYSDTSYGHGHRYALSYQEDHAFVLASRLLSTEQMVSMVNSMALYPMGLFAPGDPGSCPGVKGGYGTNWVLPLTGASYQLVNNFKEGHPGIDIGAPEGTPVQAAADGTVIFAGESTYGYGNTVVLSHGTTYTLYAHLNTVSVACGQNVTASALIGTVGSTGNSSAPHLHFELIAADWSRLDPNSILNFLTLISPNPVVNGPVCVDMCD